MKHHPSGDITFILFIFLIGALALSGIIRTSGDSDDTNMDDAGTRVGFRVEGEDPVFDCYLAVTGSERSKGLMNVKDLDDDKGMLFVYDPPDFVSFWMKNTYIGLDIIFISQDMKVIAIHEASPGAGLPDTEIDRFTSEKAVAFVLEINRGFSASYGIGIGTEVEIDMK